MANEPLALAIRPPDAPDEDEYRTLCAALSASARGRAFLAEYARRNRNADTEALLAAIGRSRRACAPTPPPCSACATICACC